LQEEGEAVILLGLLFVVALVVLLPLGLIWSLNTLFGLAIAYSFKMWLAAFVLLTVFPRGISKSS
jgi:hypothetical protein